jgi:TolA-binding protein
MASAISKHEIRRNPLAEWVGLTVRFVQKRRAIVLAALVVLLVLGVAGAAYLWYQARQDREASIALSEAQAGLRSEKPGETPKLEDSIRRYQAIARQFRGTVSAEEALIRLGNLQYDNGKMDEAKAAFDDYLKSYPRGRFVLMAGLGKAYAEEAKGDLQGAAQTLSDTLNGRSDAPFAGELYTALARVYEHLKKTDEAVRVYNQIVEHYPQTSWAQNALTRMSALKAK